MCLQLETTPRAKRASPDAKSVERALAETRARWTKSAIASLVRRFLAGKLPREEWTHEAHLLVALHHARRHAPGEAVARLRDAIRRHNKAVGTPETETRGYHETITLAWFHLVRHFLDLFDDGRPLPDLASALCVLYGSKDELFLHYSRERLLGLEARKGWVEPDRLPLPVLEADAREQEWLNRLDARAAALNANARPAAARALALTS